MLTIQQIDQEIAQHLAQVEALRDLRKAMTPPPTVPPTVVVSGMVDGDSNPDKILAFMNANRTRRFKAEHICAEVVPGVDIHTVRGQLGRLERGKKIRRLKRGWYQALPAQVREGGPKVPDQAD
jgi:hypothetical protein